ncbi:hypothetical protein LBMAG53_38640 [Planctomycetota bacterium]|nr:hypothetical protein LBMAG53_38640 [Planctomycetota bacterium]
MSDPERSSSRTDTAQLQSPSPLPPLSEIAAVIAAGGELVEAARQVAKRRDNVLGLLLRDLTREEIAVMEDRGCRAESWAQVQVAQDFDCFRVRRSRFQGRCVLGRFTGDIEVVAGIKAPSGIFDSTLINCQVGNDGLMENVRFAANLVIEHQAILYDVGSITCSGTAVFGTGQDLPLGIETGGREVPLWAECTIDHLAAVARNRHDTAGLEGIRRAVERYRDALRSPVGWVRRGAHVRHTTRIHDAYIGAGALVDHALALDNVALLSSVDEPVQILGGAAVTDSVVQWGAKAAGNAIVRHAVLLEHSGVDQHATVEGSAIGPNTSIAKGEVTASLVGPFVGFHHQSMLIAALWPEGKGNVAHGAMVGSNHTGRAPDQEIWPGEGTFFGLGCAIRFPSDFSEAPYTVIAMGVTTLPQRLSYPFSLITVPVDPVADDRVPRAFPELIPGWGLGANAYGLARAELKFAKRDRSRRHRFDYKVFRPWIMRLVKQARDRLKAVKTPLAVYLDSDLDGLGRNFLREESRLQAIASYDQALVRYALRLLLNEKEGRLTIAGSAEIAHELADEALPGLPFPQRMQRLLEIERENAQLVESSKTRDDERGARIIPGYADAHLPARLDPVVQNAWERVRVTEQRVARALG